MSNAQKLILISLAFYLFVFGVYDHWWALILAPLCTGFLMLYLFVGPQLHKLLFGDKYFSIEPKVEKEEQKNEK